MDNYVLVNPQVFLPRPVGSLYVNITGLTDRLTIYFKKWLQSGGVISLRRYFLTKILILTAVFDIIIVESF